MLKIDSQFDSLVQSVAFFASPNEASRKIVMEQSGTQFDGKKFAIEIALRQATMQLSALLDLDELQTHILLKRYIKDSCDDEKALESARASNKPMELSLEAMTSILSFYFDERLALLKSLQSILMLGVENKELGAVAVKLIKGSIEDKTFALIRSTLALLGPSPGSSLEPHGAIEPASASSTTGGGGGIYARMAAVAKVLTASGGAIGASTVVWMSSCHTSIREQLFRECCELLSILLFIYELPDLRASLPNQSDTLRALELIRIGGNFFPNLPPSEFGSSKSLAEQLVSVLILSTLNLHEYIALSSQAPQSSPSSFDQIVTLSSALGDISKGIKSWGATETNALLNLTWSSIAKLVEPYSKVVGEAASDFQGAAMSCNGFKAMSQSLLLIPGLSSSAFGQLTRNLLMKALSVISTAYELSPNTLTRDLLYDYMNLIRLIVAGDASLCSAVWEGDLDLTQPIRSLLRDARNVFPAEASTFVQMLLIFSEGAESTIAAYEFLQSVPHLSILHELTDQTITHCFIDGSEEESVILGQPALWNLAPSVITMVLPEGIQGLAAPLPAVLSHLELSKKLILWDVKGTHESFGQLLLLGRAAHCLSVVDSSLRSQSPVDQPSLECLVETVELISRFCKHGSERLQGNGATIVQDLMSLSIDLSSGAKCTWLEIATNAVSVLIRLSMAGFSLPSSSVQLCFALMKDIASHSPVRVLTSIHHTEFLCPSRSLFGAEDQSTPSYLPVALDKALEDSSYAALALGLLPGLTTYVTEVEAKGGEYASLAAFLDLSTSLLRAGHQADPLPAYVAFALHEILPLHQRIPFKNAAARWKLKGAVLRLLDASLSAGAVSELTLADDCISGLKITPVAAHVISHLLLHGHAVLSSCLPSIEYLDYLRASDAASVEAAAAEDASQSFLQLVSKLLVSSATWRTAQGSSTAMTSELPLETFLLYGDGSPSPPPMSLIASLINYEDQRPGTDETSTTSSLAVNVLHALMEAGRGVSSSSFTAVISGALSSNIHSLTAVCSVLKVDKSAPQVDPKANLLASAVVDLIEAATVSPVASEVLDVILFPTGLDPSFQDKPAATPAATVGGEVAPVSSALAVAFDGPKTMVKSPHPSAWSFLDSLSSLMVRAPELLAGSEGGREALSLGFRAMSVLWQLGGTPVHFLRVQPSTWSAIEACLTHGQEDGDLWQVASTTHAWRVVLLEVHLTTRPSDAKASSFWNLLDSLVQNGTLLQAVKSSTFSTGEIDSAHKLSSASKACFLELGAMFFGLFGSDPRAVECNLPTASELKSNVRIVNQFLSSGHLPFADLGLVLRSLLAGPASDLDSFEDVSAHSKALMDWIQKAPLGLSIVNRCTATSDFVTRSKLGRGFLLSTSKLSSLLNSCSNQLMSVEALLDSFKELNTTASFVFLRLSRLQAVNMLLSSLLSKEPSLIRSTSRDCIHSTVEVALTNTAQLLKCISNESMDFPSIFLPHCASSSLTSWKLLVQVLGAQRPAQPKASRLVSSQTSSPASSLFPYGAPRVATIPEARTLFPATPQRSQAHENPDLSASDLAAYLLPLCSLMSSWCRNAVKGNLGTLDISSALVEISNGIMSSVLMALIPITGDINGTLISVLAGALPHICALCMESESSGRGVLVPVAIQLVTELVRLLPSSDWLPILNAHLDLPSLMSSSVSLERGHVGMLQLATLVSRSPEGARNLMDQGALFKMTDLARTMLSAKGGGLAPFASLELPLHNKIIHGGHGGTWDISAISRPPISSQLVDTSLAYTRKGSEPFWSPAHQQWCVLLSFSSALIRSLGQHFDVEADSIDFLSTAEPRLLLACMPPQATSSQPLTIAMLLETEKSLFLLSGLAQYAGAWQMTLPGSLSRFRTVASSFVAFAASMTAKTPPVFCCAPQSSAEDVMSKAGGLVIEEGWFKACDIGSQRPGSEYSTRLAELMYSCVYLSLSFLMASAPQLGDGEGTSLGPMWPRSRDLCIIQDQCMLVLFSISHHEQGGTRSEVEARKKHVSQLILKVLNAATDFLSIVGYPATRRNVEQTIKERIRGLEESFANGEMPNAQIFITPHSPGSPLIAR